MKVKEKLVLWGDASEGGGCSLEQAKSCASCTGGRGYCSIGTQQQVGMLMLASRSVVVDGGHMRAQVKRVYYLWMELAVVGDCF